MTTSNSPSDVIRDEASKIAAVLKAAVAGETIADEHSTAWLEASRKTKTFTFSILMEDKVVKISLLWNSVRDTDLEGITEFIANRMRGGRQIEH